MIAAAFIVMLCFERGVAEFYYKPYNVTRSTLSGIAAYRSSLTLDWMAAEDMRQRELAAAFETEAPPVKVLSTDCIAYPRPAPGKIGRLMLELLKNLEGDEGFIIQELIQVLIRSKLLVENSVYESEPDLDLLVKTPGILKGEPHATFPRILAVVWMSVTDPYTTRKYGWCPITKINQYLSMTKPIEIAKHMRSLDMVVARARFIMEDFIQSITPMNMYHKETTKKINKPKWKTSTKLFPNKRLKEQTPRPTLRAELKDLSNSSVATRPKLKTVINYVPAANSSRQLYKSVWFSMLFIIEMKLLSL